MEKTKTGAKSTKEHAKCRRQQGITLISLVITIIVLLILAGVAINLALDSNGIFSRANEAVEKYNNGVAKEEGELQNLLNLGDEITNTVPEGWNMEKVSQIIRQGNRKAPIPVGYTVSQIEGEGTIAGGLVIYEGETIVTGEKGGEAHEKAMKERNQYVWIPVDDINDMVMCHKNTIANEKGEKICHLAFQDGKLICTTHNERDFAGRFYVDPEGNKNYTMDENENKIYTYNIDFTEKEQTYEVKGDYYCEPAVITGESGDEFDGASENYHGLGTADELLKQLQKDFNSMAESVATYGGFYITRYALGTEGTSKKDQELYYENWYTAYNMLKSSNGIGNFHMIWGSQYDQVIKFIGKEAETVHMEIQNANKQPITGQDRMKNIYDLEGPRFIWTAEASLNRRIVRGSDFAIASALKEYRPTSFRITYPPTSEAGVFATLYL